MSATIVSLETGGAKAAALMPDTPPRRIVIADAATQQPGAGGSRLYGSGLAFALPWLLPVVLIGAWQLAAMTGALSRGVLPAPSDVVTLAWNLAERGTLQHDIFVSLRRVAIGFTIGASTGLILGFLVGVSRLARTLLDRSLQMVRTIPHLALVPLMILWFGIGEEPRLILVAMGSFFPVYLNTMSGVRNVDAKLVELGRSYGLGPLAVLYSVVLPGSLQPILVGLRYALGVAWLTLVIGETIASRDGIGYLVQNARELLRTDVIVLAIGLYAIAGWLTDLLARLAERRALRWHPSYAERVES